MVTSDLFTSVIFYSSDTNSIVNGKKDASDVITIPSGSSSDSDSVISVPLR